MTCEEMRGIRRSKKLTQREIAQAIGISYTTYADFERGCRPLSAESYKAIMDYYQVPVDSNAPIRDRRRRCGVTAKTLSHLSGVHANTIYTLEEGGTENSAARARVYTALAELEAPLKALYSKAPALPKTITFRRYRLEMLQRELAKRAGVSSSVVSDTELGKCKNKAVIMRIEAALTEAEREMGYDDV